MKHDPKNHGKNDFTLVQEWKVIKQTFRPKWFRQEINLAT